MLVVSQYYIGYDCSDVDWTNGKQHAYIEMLAYSTNRVVWQPDLYRQLHCFSATFWNSQQQGRSIKVIN